MTKTTKTKAKKTSKGSTKKVRATIKNKTGKTNRSKKETKLKPLNFIPKGAKDNTCLAK